jgi:hypothetical protein
MQFIVRHATVFPVDEYEKYRQKTVKRLDPDADAVYVCPVCVNSKNSLFIEMDWDSTYRGANTDFDGIIKYILEETEAKNKPRAKKPPSKKRNQKVLPIATQVDNS